MIRYEKGAFNPRTLIALRGSVFGTTVPPAVLCGILGAAFKLACQRNESFEYFFANVLNNNSAYSSFSVLLGFLVVFRTQLSYSRFWDGCKFMKEMQAEFFVTGSNLVAFCRQSKADPGSVMHFQELILRLLSMLHAVALAQLHGKEYNFKPLVIGFTSLDSESLLTVRKEECKVELVVQWLQAVTVDAQTHGVLNIAPPILSRIFQNLSNGLSAYYSAYRVTEVPYPFPYMQATEVLLVVYWVVTPCVMVNFTELAFWSGFFSFLASLILLSLNQIAAELEDPFGKDANDLNLDEMQNEMNKRLLMLTAPSTGQVPRLSVSMLTVSTSRISECATMEEANLRDLVTQMNVWNNGDDDANSSAMHSPRDHSQAFWSLSSAVAENAAANAAVVPQKELVSMSKQDVSTKGIASEPNGLGSFSEPVSVSPAPPDPGISEEGAATLVPVVREQPERVAGVCSTAGAPTLGDSGPQAAGCPSGPPEPDGLRQDPGAPVSGEPPPETDIFLHERIAPVCRGPLLPEPDTCLQDRVAPFCRRKPIELDVPMPCWACRVQEAAVPRTILPSSSAQNSTASRQGASPRLQGFVQEGSSSSNSVAAKMMAWLTWVEAAPNLETEGAASSRGSEPWRPETWTEAQVGHPEYRSPMSPTASIRFAAAQERPPGQERNPSRESADAQCMRDLYTRTSRV
mmetsp:Transcript_151562/g.385336  ORF Transcript_151562/g.385336 Transcript_151562/m.385336 type:complete len:687 (+) Transcript_151562:55-2115(+)